jgi:hypothetical protein
LRRIAARMYISARSRGGTYGIVQHRPMCGYGSSLQVLLGPTWKLLRVWQQIQTKITRFLALKKILIIQFFPFFPVLAEFETIFASQMNADY